MAGPWIATRYLVELPDAVLLLAIDPKNQGCPIAAPKVSLEIIDKYKDSEAQSNGTYLKKSASGNEYVTGLFARKDSTHFQQSLPGNDFGNGYESMTPPPYVLDDWEQWEAINHPSPLE